ncbi:MAG TPA: DoxX family protein [Beijerinckiaceae bacterium]|nr:DoxX family protein [Beijerinckiaceae bacterium]
MNTTTSQSNAAATPASKGEPRPFIPALAPLYAVLRDLSYPLIRITVGATTLTHGWGKLTSTTDIASFAANSMAKRGIEPALPIAYLVYANETVGAICLIFGFLTRLWAASLAIELAVITFGVFFPHGYGATSPGGGWEYPLMWGLITFAIALRGGGPYSLDRALGIEL